MSIVKLNGSMLVKNDRKKKHVIEMLNYICNDDASVKQHIKTIYDNSIINFKKIAYHDEHRPHINNNRHDTYLRFILELLCYKSNHNVLLFLQKLLKQKSKILFESVIMNDHIVFPSLTECAIVLMEECSINSYYLDVLLEHKKPVSILHSCDGYYDKNGNYTSFGCDPDDFIKLGTIFGIMIARGDVSLKTLYFLDDQSKHEYALSYCNYWFHRDYKNGDYVNMCNIEQIIDFYCDNDFDGIEFDNIEFYHYANVVDKWINDSYPHIHFNNKKYALGDNLLIIFIIIVHMILKHHSEFANELLTKLRVKHENKVRAALIFLISLGEDVFHDSVFNNYKVLVETDLLDSTSIIFVNYRYFGEYIIICGLNGKKILEYEEDEDDEEDYTNEITALKNKFYSVELHDDYIDYDDDDEVTKVNYNELYKHCFSFVTKTILG